MREILMLAAFYSAMVAGVVFPEPSSRLAPYIKFFMAGILFLAFLKITPGDVWRAMKGNPWSLFLLSMVKLLAFPVVAYFISLWSIPEFAESVLLLSACSTAVAAPFFASLIGGNISYCLVMSVVTSLLLPLVLPILVHFLLGDGLEMNPGELATFLASIILVPMAGSFMVQRLLPGLAGVLGRRSYPISLALITTVVFGSLGRFADYLLAHAGHLAASLLAGFLLAAAAGLTGWLIARNAAREDRISAMGSMIWMNNVVTLAIGVESNEPLLAMLSALYMVPLFLAIVVLGRVGPAPGLEVSHRGQLH